MASWFKRSSASSSGNAAPAPDLTNGKAAQGRPLLLIGFNDASRQWEVGQDALSILQTVRGPLCTVSVCGRARQGKSFLLNQLLSKFTGVDRPNGFVVSPTHQSCTRGIWIWSVPIVVTAADGHKCSTILMDCEGVDAVDQGQQHSAQIFSLAVLLSSIFVYNQIGAIDAIAIERLAMVCELAKRIKDMSLAGGASSRSSLAAGGQVDFSPAFVWLLRDFQLRLESNGHPITPAEYLEESLLPVQGGEVDVANRNKMRSTIKAVFPDRDVATMVRPALSEAHLQTLDQLPYSSLRPEFRRDMDMVAQLIKAKIRPLAVGGSLVTGTALAGLAAAYVQAVNQGAVPQLVTAWQGVSRAESQKAFESALTAYSNRFDVQGITDDHALYEQHQTALAAALDTFKEAAMGDPELLGEFEGKLRQQLEGRYVEAKRKLAATGERLASEMLAAESAQLKEMMSKPGATIEAVEAELRRFLDDYDLKVSSGPYKYKKAAEFLMNTTIIGIKGIVKGILAAKDQAQARATAAEANVVQLEAKVRNLSDIEVRASAAEQQLLHAKQEIARLTGQLDARSRQASVLDLELTQLRQSEAQGSTARQDLQRQLAETRGQTQHLQMQLAAAQNAAGELQQLRGQLADAARREAVLQQEKAAAQEKATSLAAQLSAGESLVQQLESEVTAGRSHLAELQGQVNDLNRQLQQAQAAAANKQLEDNHIEGQLDEERRKLTGKIQEIAKLTADLASERAAHDSTRIQLAQAKGIAGIRSPTAPTAAAAGASPAGRGTAGATACAAAGRSSRKRQRVAADAADEEMQGL
eukprot:GHRR01028142.1.p1 GENE.GHRR01028142.1~~GHRR01028142.1.p1  ORF type:complete len:811 (+),score=359.13 GHRR01028142.1:614-3046(+)